MTVDILPTVDPDEQAAWDHQYYIDVWIEAVADARDAMGRSFKIEIGPESHAAFREGISAAEFATRLGDKYDGLFAEVCNVVERMWLHWPLEGGEGGPWLHTSDDARAAARKICDILGIET
jgi:hypothetical protein